MKTVSEWMEQLAPYGITQADFAAQGKRSERDSLWGLLQQAALNAMQTSPEELLQVYHLQKEFLIEEGKPTDHVQRGIKNAQRMIDRAPKEPAANAVPAVSSGLKTCPFCAETDLQENASVCKHCRRDLPASPMVAAIGKSNQWGTYSAGTFAAGIVFLFIMPPIGLFLLVCGMLTGIVSLWQSIVATGIGLGGRQFTNAERLVAKICLPIIALFGLAVCAAIQGLLSGK